MTAPTVIRAWRTGGTEQTDDDGAPKMGRLLKYSYCLVNTKWYMSYAQRNLFYGYRERNAIPRERLEELGEL